MCLNHLNYVFECIKYNGINGERKITLPFAQKAVKVILQPREGVSSAIYVVMKNALGLGTGLGEFIVQSEAHVVGHFYTIQAVLIA